MWISANGDGMVQKYSYDGKLLLQIGAKGVFDTADGAKRGPGANAAHDRLNKPAGIAVSSSQRLGGALAAVPTWQELGFQSSGSWKGVMGPKGITPAQVAYWEDVLRRASQSDELRQYAEQNQWLLEFKGAAETKKWLDEEFAALKSAMTALGLVRQQ